MGYSDEVLADSPTGYWKCDDASGNLTDSSGGGHTGTAAGSPSYGSAGPMTGALAVGTTSGDFSVADHADFDLGNGPFSIEFWFARTAATSAGYPIAKTDSSFAVGGFAVELREGATDTLRLQTGDTSTHINNTAQLFSDTNWHHAVFTRASATTAKLYIDGTAAALSTSAKTFSDNALALVIGALYSGSARFPGLMSRVAIYKSELTSTRVTAHFDAATGGESNPVTVTPGVAALTITTYAPTVTASDHKTVTPGVASLTLTPLAPTVTVNVIAEPATAVLALTAFAPTVTASDHQTVTPGTASLALTAFAPTVATPVTVTPDAASLALSAFAPTVAVTAHVTVTPDVAALTLTTYAPTVTGGAGLTVTPDTASLSLTAFAPDVVASDHKLVTPGTAALTLGLFAPSVLTPITVTPGVLALTLTAYAPTVSAGAVLTGGSPPGVGAAFSLAPSGGGLNRTPGTGGASLVAPGGSASILAPKG